MFDTVECPYCEHENDMSEGTVDLPSDNTFDSECEKCEREFEVHVEFDPVYSAIEIEYVDCEKCERETRDPAKRGKIFPFPESLNGDTFCMSCFYRGVHADDLKRSGL